MIPGSTYFTVWTILNSLHIAGTYVWSIRYLTTFTEALTSILVSRFILNLREVATAPNPADENDPATDAYWDLLESWRVADRFPTAASVDVTSLLAPLGAPLDHSLGESYERELGAPGERTVRAADVSVAQAGSGGRDAKQFSGLIRTHRAGSWLRGQRAARHSSCGSPAGQTL
ncbi:hypothetical protein BD414DRAFT_316520 [Trametes punicea]|nr:hypothetical protein BD414DRAFT_316520 [Trametes punicea]